MKRTLYLLPMLLLLGAPVANAAEGPGGVKASPSPLPINGVTVHVWSVRRVHGLKGAHIEAPPFARPYRVPAPSPSPTPRRAR